MHHYKLFRSYLDPSPIGPPKLHPKTASISAEIAALSNSGSTQHQPTLATMQELGNEEYVAPDVFRIDRQTQEEIDVRLPIIYIIM